MIARLQENPVYRLSSQNEGNDLVVRVEMLREIPVELSLIVGDLLHNARSALDLLVFELAQAGAGNLGRAPTGNEERSLFFPISTETSSFRRSAATLAGFVGSAALRRIEEMQPWHLATTAQSAGRPLDDTEREAAITLDRLRRLSVLNNFDKHRTILFTLWRPNSVEYGTTERPDDVVPGVAGADSMNLDPLTMERISAAIEADGRRSDSIDFYFADEGLTDGAEVGRFIRHDRGMVSEDLNIQGDLRLVIWEPGLTDESQGGPAASVLTQDFIDEVQAVCDYISASSTVSG